MLLLLEKGLDLLQALLILGNIKVFLNDSNEHVEYNDLLEKRKEEKCQLKPQNR